MKVSMNNEVTAKQLQALVDILHDNVGTEKLEKMLRWY